MTPAEHNLYPPMTLYESYYIYYTYLLVAASLPSKCIGGPNHLREACSPHQFLVKASKHLKGMSPAGDK